MREIACSEISALVSRLYQEANFILPADVVAALEGALLKERSLLGREVLETLLTNAEIASRRRVPLCQDTGMAVVFVEVGQDVHLSGPPLQDCVDEGVACARAEGFLRASVLSSPVFERVNTGNNTPAIVHAELVAGDGFEVAVMPKGAGSENMSRVAMLKPYEGVEGIIGFVMDAVRQAGANPCPPVFLGIGIGGTMDKAALLAKKALLRPVGAPNADAALAGLENDILERVNSLGVGPGGFGGTVTCLSAAIEEYPSHIASLPVAVSIQCNCHRRAKGRL